MSHPLISSLTTLAALLEEHAQQATTPSLLKALDKVSASVRTATELLQSAAEGNSPEFVALSALLKRALATPADAKALKAQLTKLLGKLPGTKAGTSVEDNLASYALRKDKAQAAITLVQQFINRPTFDASSGDKYELLKQIRNLGRMDEQQKKAAKAFLASKPAVVEDLCAAAGIAIVNKKGVKVATNKLITSLIQHGQRYAENTGA